MCCVYVVFFMLRIALCVPGGLYGIHLVAYNAIGVDIGIVILSFFLSFCPFLPFSLFPFRND